MEALALGNYPTPVVGYGGSAIIGYVLSLMALPKSVEASVAGVSAAADETDQTLIDPTLRVGIARMA